jgi:hypothetical protein
MLLSAGLMVLTIVLVLVHEARSANDSHQHCPPSSCGNIHNISYPFWLNGDPTICGDPKYNLSCENNQTVLYLYDGRYYVQEIDYNNYTIRVVDSGIQKDNYSFIPRYSLGSSNFSLRDPYTPSYPSIQVSSEADQSSYSCNVRGGFDDLHYQRYMVFVNCEKQVKSRLYLDISTCFKNGVYSSNSFLSHSKRYTYVIADQITVLDLEESCQIEQMSLATTSWLPYWPNNHSSVRYFLCNDFYDAVVSGFMLSWFQATCDNFTDSYCYINDYANNSVQCNVDPMSAGA